MKRLLVFLLALIGAVWVGLKLTADTGYVLLAYESWSVELSLLLACLVVVIAFLVFYGAIRFFKEISRSKKHLKQWGRTRRWRRSLVRTSRGLIALAEGDWQKAEKDLIQGIVASDTPLINYLAAARAAQEQGAYDRRDDYLRMAHETTPGAEIAVGMVQAQLQLSHRQLEQSLATLQRLRELAPHHTYVLKQLERIYFELHDWENLAKLLPELSKYKVFSATEEATLIERVYQELLTATATKQNSVDALRAVWVRIPKPLRHSLGLLRLYAKLLIEKEEGDVAEQLLRDKLKHTWDDELARLYGLAKGEDNAKQLAFAETWLKNEESNPVSLLTLGRLSMRNQLWGKARDYLEKSLQFATIPETCSELAMLLDKLGQPDIANDYYRKGLMLVAGTRD